MSFEIGACKDFRNHSRRKVGGIASLNQPFMPTPFLDMVRDVSGGTLA
jgi:hypothetical protein